MLCLSGISLGAQDTFYVHPSSSLCFQDHVRSGKSSYRPDPEEFPGGPVVRTCHFHCQGPGFNPSRGTKIPQATRCVQKNKHTNKRPKIKPELGLAIPREIPTLHSNSGQDIRVSLFFPVPYERFFLSPNLLFCQGCSPGRVLLHMMVSILTPPPVSLEPGLSYPLSSLHSIPYPGNLTLLFLNFTLEESQHGSDHAQETSVAPHGLES